MSAFTEAEARYLSSQTMGRFATIGRDGQPHIIPLTFQYNAGLGTIDLGGIDFTNAKKWRDVQHNRRVTFLVDDFAPTGAHAVEIRGTAEVHPTGGRKINPRFPNFVEEFIRILPTYIVSWGIEEEGPTKAKDFRANGRKVTPHA